MKRLPSDVARVEREGLTLHAERIGSKPAATPVLLLSAAEAPSSRWPAELISVVCDQVGDVIRFDNRDSGRSDDAENGYLLEDLAGDAFAVLDHFGVEEAHVVGRSMGAMVGQLMAIDHPERVRSLTIVSSTAGPDPAHGGPAQWFVELMSERLFGDPPRTFEERVRWIVDQQEWFSGGRYPFDREAAAESAAEEVAQFWHDDVGHGLAVVDSPPRHDRLAKIQCPTLVVHGTADPVYPVLHGQALAREIPNAEIRLVEDLGHELPDELVPLLSAWLLELIEQA